MSSSGHGMVVSTTIEESRRSKAGLVLVPLVSFCVRLGFLPPSWVLVGSFMLEGGGASPLASPTVRSGVSGGACRLRLRSS